MPAVISQAVGYVILAFYFIGAVLAYQVIRRRAPELLRQPDLRKLLSTYVAFSWLTLLGFTMAFVFDRSYQRVMTQVRAHL